MFEKVYHALNFWLFFVCALLFLTSATSQKLIAGELDYRGTVTVDECAEYAETALQVQKVRRLQKLSYDQYNIVRYDIYQPKDKFDSMAYDVIILKVYELNDYHTPADAYTYMLSMCLDIIEEEMRIKRLS